MRPGALALRREKALPAAFQAMYTQPGAGVELALLGGAVRQELLIAHLVAAQISTCHPCAVGVPRSMLIFSPSITSNGLAVGGTPTGLAATRSAATTEAQRQPPRHDCCASRSSP